MALPTLTIDVIPLILIWSAIAASLALALVLRGDRPAFLRIWTVGGMLLSLSNPLVFLNGRIPELLSILVGNLSLIAAYACFSTGSAALAGRNLAPVNILLGAIGGLAFMLCYLAGVGIEGRIACMSIIIIGFSFLMLTEFAEVFRNGMRTTPVRLVLLALAAIIALSLGRLLLNIGPVLLPVDVLELNRTTLLMDVLATAAVVTAILSVNWAMRPRAVASRWREAMAGDAASPERSFSDALPGWTLSQSSRILTTPGGVDLRLTGNEYLLLQQLCGAAEGPVPRGALNAAIGRDMQDPKDRSIDILLSRLRRKCTATGAELPITSVRGRGYVFHGDLRLG